MGGVGLSNPEFEIDPPIRSGELNDACTIYAEVKANLIEVQEIPEVFESSRATLCEWSKGANHAMKKGLHRRAEVGCGKVPKIEG